jgi:hypothetical protein
MVLDRRVGACSLASFDSPAIYHRGADPLHSNPKPNDPMNLVIALQLAGLLHFGLIAAGVTMPKVIKLRESLAALPAFPRRLFWVYYVFVGYTILGIALLTLCFSHFLAGGSPPARAICAFIGLFWTLRLATTFGILDTRQFLTSLYLRAGNALLNLVFTYLACIYLWAALKGLL